MDNFEVDNYLYDFDRATSKGACVACLKLVHWNRSRFADNGREEILRGAQTVIILTIQGIKNATKVKIGRKEN